MFTCASHKIIVYTSGITLILKLIACQMIIKITFTIKTLQEETSSTNLLFTESRYRTSENPLFLALVIAFKTYTQKKNDKTKHVVHGRFKCHSRTDT